MAKAIVKTGVTLKLSEEEAVFLAALLGKVGGMGLRKFSHSIYDALGDVGISASFSNHALTEPARIFFATDSSMDDIERD